MAAFSCSLSFGLLFSVIAAADQGAGPQSLDSPHVTELIFTEDAVFGIETDGDSEGRLGKVYGVAVDSKGVVHILDPGFECVHRYSEDGVYLDGYGAEGEGPGDFRNPQAITIGPDDKVYIGGHGSLISVFDAEGIPVAAHKRDPSTFQSPVSSIALGPRGAVYVCSADITRHTVVFKHDPVDFTVLTTFADTYAVGHDVEPWAERVFAGGFVANLSTDELVYIQMAPPEIRFYDHGGSLLRSFPTHGSDTGLPVSKREGDRTTFYTPEMTSHKIVALDEGRFLVTVLKPSRNKERRTTFEGEVFVDLCAASGRRLKTTTYQRRFLPECPDRKGRVYVNETREVEGSEMPVVVRYVLE